MPTLPDITKPESVSRTTRNAARSRGSGRMREPIVAEPEENVRKRPGTGDVVSIRQRVVDLLGRDVMLLYVAKDAQRDQAAIGRRMGDVAGAEERRRGKALAHRDKVAGGLWQNVAQRRAVALRIRRRKQAVLPRGIEVAIVPGDVFIDHGSCRRMRCDVLDLAFADHPHLASIAQRITVVGAGSHGVFPVRTLRGRSLFFVRSGRGEHEHTPPSL